MDTRRIVAQYNGVFTAPPTNVPTEYFVDGPLMGNGDVGVVISGRPEAQRFWISKTDKGKQVMLGPEGVPLDELQHRMASRQ